MKNWRSRKIVNAEAINGTVSAGPGDSGRGFRVVAVLPLADATQDQP